MYQQMIREDLVRRRQDDRYDPRHVEAWMRSEHGTLDSLSKVEFRNAVTLAIECINHGGRGMSERLAQCEGL